MLVLSIGERNAEKLLVEFAALFNQLPNKRGIHFQKLKPLVEGIKIHRYRALKFPRALESFIDSPNKAEVVSWENRSSSKRLIGVIFLLPKQFCKLVLIGTDSILEVGFREIGFGDRGLFVGDYNPIVGVNGG